MSAGRYWMRFSWFLTIPGELVNVGGGEVTRGRFSRSPRHPPQG